MPPKRLLQQFVFHMTNRMGDNTIQASRKSSRSGCIHDTSWQITSFSSDRLDGPDQYNWDLKYPHNQKSASVKSEDRGGHGNLQFLIMILSFPEHLYREYLDQSSSLTSCSILHKHDTTFSRRSFK
ncbi:hypothetical protein AVEN_142661-1 [Araneus ventricosus]|uniref:Uncharacterized protein n=1 Tax=Araneus ventricosus TaxID=182803 RepID=A0A4Y2A298_ARAVE|nr:hypothetical protein AVEN_142661-1 [Araneus ventricosus]